jgi:hypothetical protein
MASNSTHRHQVISWVTVGFNGCVAPDQCVPEAHGDITDIAKCSCGAVQKANINGKYREIGPGWSLPKAREE